MVVIYKTTVAIHFFPMYCRCTRVAHNVGLHATADKFLWPTKSILAPSESRKSLLLCLQQSVRIKAGLFILKLKVIKLKGMGQRRRAAHRKKWVMRVIFILKPERNTLLRNPTCTE